MRVCIDAGHGGHDPGAGAHGRREKDETLNFALYLEKEMERRGHEVVMTRTDDRYIELRERAEVANRAGCDYFLSLHFNSASPSATGVETLVAKRASQVSHNLGEDLTKAVAGVAGLQVRRGDGVYVRDVTVLTTTTMPANLLELAFISNAGDMQKIDRNKQRVIGAIADTLEAQFGRLWPLDTEKPTIDDIVLNLEAKKYWEINLHARGVDDNVAVERLQFIIYPEGETDNRQYFDGRRSKSDPSRWARKISLDEPSTYVLRARAFDAAGNRSEFRGFEKFTLK